MEGPRSIKQITSHAGKHAGKWDHLFMLVEVQTCAAMVEILEEVVNILTNWGNGKLKTNLMSHLKSVEMDIIKNTSNNKD